MATDRLFACASARREGRILKLTPTLVGASQLSEILFQPEAVEHVGHRPERNASVAPFDGAQGGA
jgi:hypothetical protein